MDWPLPKRQPSPSSELETNQTSKRTRPASAAQDNLSASIVSDTHIDWANQFGILGPPKSPRGASEDLTLIESGHDVDMSSDPSLITFTTPEFIDETVANEVQYGAINPSEISFGAVSLQASWKFYNLMTDGNSAV